MRKIIPMIFAVLFFASFRPESLRAQATWGAISGFVSDPSGSAVPNASVTVTQVETGVSTGGRSDAAGLYNITHLLPGEYTLTVEASGFKRFVQKHIALQ